MNDVLADGLISPWVLGLVAGLLLIIWLLVRRRRAVPRTLASVINDIAFARIQGLVIPKADEGEIQIDYLVLTAQGLLIVEVKDVVGAVFGSDKMQDWTVIGENSRFTFSNPQPALYDRVAAVRKIVRQVPVTGRIVFLDGATFTKGVPNMVCSLDGLRSEFAEEDKAAANAKIEAFKPHWEQIQ
ncbi:MAG: nuclease-related domain-containing protein, partial [Woeseiales bacterium]